MMRGLGPSLGRGQKSSLDHDFDIGGGHGHPQIPEYDRAGIAVQDADEEVMRSPEVDIGDEGQPLLMRTLGLIEPLSGRFSSLWTGPLAGQARLSEHSEDRGRKDYGNPLVQHHIRQPDSTHGRMLALEGQDLLPFFRQDPVSIGKDSFRAGFFYPPWRSRTERDFLMGNPARSKRTVTLFMTSSAISGATWVPVRGPQFLTAGSLWRVPRPLTQLPDPVVLLQNLPMQNLSLLVHLLGERLLDPFQSLFGPPKDQPWCTACFFCQVSKADMVFQVSTNKPDLFFHGLTPFIPIFHGGRIFHRHVPFWLGLFPQILPEKGPFHLTKDTSPD